MSDLTERLDRLAKGIEITEVLWPGTLLKYPDAGEAALRIAELEAAVTDCHAGHTAIERGYLARIAELESADAMITNTCDLVARLETLEAAINNVIEISDKFPSSAPGLTPYNIEYRNGWDDAAGILREALEGKDGAART